MNAGRAGRAYQLMGYEKINRSYFQAMDDGLRYIWVDTCCIDKTSSAELSEAINSMFLWYRNAEVCYAYLSDVDEDSELSGSLWFTRGWTLQELLAPSKVVFYGHGWTLLGTRESLKIRLSDITGIRSLHDFQNASIAQKMSWASKRITTRVEDMAYCLLGLFGVYMPPLYGEGKNAFLRLRLEILSKSDDESIFATTEDLPESGMLAASPASFCDSGDVVQIGVGGIDRIPYHMTNKGLELKADITSISTNHRFGLILLPINCKRVSQMAITLRHSHGDQYFRLPMYLIPSLQYSGLPMYFHPRLPNPSTVGRTLYIRQWNFDTPYLADGAPGRYEFLIQNYFGNEVEKFGTKVLGVITRRGGDCQLELTDTKGHVLQFGTLNIIVSASLPGSWATIIYKTDTNMLFGTMLYFDNEFRVGIHVLDLAESGLHEQLSTGEPIEALQKLNKVPIPGDAGDFANKASDTRREIGHSFAEGIKKIVKGQGKTNILTQKLHPMVEDTFRKLLSEGSRQLSHTAQLTMIRPLLDLTVHATLTGGPNLGKKRFGATIRISKSL
ncbi:hypothetical protein HYALB_00011492 [Hymenoscyphus albidus]|uniref:Heterokaryon incompatibility domain-containing protein n=1 Tax=Hymenoscyphus albidus TaxID=595503 RepID=A0A9N9LT62_9HELO|nr:hypothetical protein HYALB_00011492 [Hymenoscyphus albidus]